MIKLLAVDMDGTCLNHKNLISNETLEALRLAANAGITVVPTTGRTTTCIPAQLKNMPIFRYVISSNGADVLDTQTNETIFKALIPNLQAVEILEKCRENGIGLSAHLKHDFAVQGLWLKMLGRISYGKDAKNTQCVKDIVKMLKQDKSDVEELQLFFLTKNQRNFVQKVLANYESLFTAYTSNYVEVYDKKASKGNALKALAQHLNIKKEEIACIGDAENDFSMFSVSGLKMAMGNAISSLKEQADIILPTNDESGVAYAINQYLLMK